VSQVGNRLRSYVVVWVQAATVKGCSTTPRNLAPCTIGLGQGAGRCKSPVKVVILTTRKRLKCWR